MKSISTICLLSSFLYLLTFLMFINATATTTNYKVRFRALSFSMACSKDTSEKQKRYLPGATTVAGDIKRSNCINAKRQVTDVKPEGVDVKHDDTFGKFEVVIHLNKNDAKALSEITKKASEKGPPEKIFVGADGSIVSAGYMNEPFAGSDYYISAESHEDAHNLAALFVSKLEKKP